MRWIWRAVRQIKYEEYFDIIGGCDWGTEAYGSKCVVYVPGESASIVKR